MGLFKGKEKRNDEAIIRILGTKGEMTIWDIAKQLLREENRFGRKEPSYHEIKSKNSVLFRRVKHHISIGYIKVCGTRFTKGNEVPLYALTFKGLIAALLILKDEDVADLIDVNYKSLTPEESLMNTFVSDVKFLLDFWRVLYKKDTEIFEHFCISPIENITSRFNFEDAKGTDIICYLSEIIPSDLLNYLDGLKRDKIQEGLIKILEEDIELIQKTIKAIGSCRDNARIKLEETNYQLIRASNTVLPLMLKRCKCRTSHERETKDEVLRQIKNMKRWKIVEIISEKTYDEGSR